MCIRYDTASYGYKRFGEGYNLLFTYEWAGQKNDHSRLRLLNFLCLRTPGI